MKLFHPIPSSHTLRSQTIVDINPEVLDALMNKRPVVALESTIITHGMPRPHNLATAIEVEEIVRQQVIEFIVPRFSSFLRHLELPAVMNAALNNDLVFELTVALCQLKAHLNFNSISTLRCESSGLLARVGWRVGLWFN